MKVTEYRRKHPNCKYCAHYGGWMSYKCDATQKKMSKRTAKKCPCYVPEKWKYDDFAEEMEKE